ncbi:universal stress protein [Pseudofulvibacter geojedonensis]|uniref:Universal stress protein n=1 Tax=Pseudofulvibacter geojedonensis TaxID=1123758 RepID=A0ABW3I1C4_9FLAO
MNRILVPTDFSPEAENALKVAAQLAKEYDSEIYLLHLLELPLDLIDPMSKGSELPEAMFFMQMAHKKFQNVIESDYLEGITIHERIQNNEAFEGIVDTAKKDNIDLIVMGSQGASGFKEMVIGSNTEKVVRTSDVPVLVIKKDHNNFKIKDLVFACEFTDEYKASFEEATRFAKSINAKMHLLMVNTPNGFRTTAEAEDKMNSFLNGNKPDNYTLNIYNDRTIEKGILNFASAIDADIIAMSTHGRKGLSHFFNGSISEDLVNHAKRPVVTFKI